jgi:group I intron endonuclease
MNKIFIYTLTDPNTKQVRYVGKTGDIKTRFERHINESKNSTLSHKKAWVNSLLNKNKEPIIEVIDVVDINEWQFWETYWISQFKTWGFYLTNMTHGGDGFSCGSIPWNKYISGYHIHSDEYKRDLSLKYSGTKNPCYGKKASEYTIELMKINHVGMSGKNHNSITKEKISDKNSGSNNGMYGKKHNDDIINKIKEASTGENHSMSKLTDSDVILMRKYYIDKTYSRKELVKMFNISQSSVFNIVTYKSWKHLV